MTNQRALTVAATILVAMPIFCSATPLGIYVRETLSSTADLVNDGKPQDGYNYINSRIQHIRDRGPLVSIHVTHELYNLYLNSDDPQRNICALHMVKKISPPHLANNTYHKIQHELTKIKKNRESWESFVKLIRY